MVSMVTVPTHPELSSPHRGPVPETVVLALKSTENSVKELGVTVRVPVGP